MVYLMWFHWDEKTKLHWDHQMELQMALNLSFDEGNDLSAQVVVLKDLIMTSLMVYLMGSHWDENTELHWDFLIELKMGL